jgi:large subunit ribosomal protein L3
MKGLGLIGKKLGMTAIFSEDGTRVPVTVVQVDRCSIIQIRDEEKDGYKALQIGYDPIPEKRVNRAQKGHQQKAANGFYRSMKEFRIEAVDSFEIGQELSVDMFEVGEKVVIQGKSKGRGFAGAMKRWNFRGLSATHGTHKVHRSTGAIGQCADPARVFKGKKMPGQMGNSQVSVKNIEIVDVRTEDKLILLRGQIPGPKKAMITIKKQV